MYWAASIRARGPKSKYPKGPFTAAAVERNAMQLELFPGYSVEISPDAEKNGRHTWVLLVHKNSSARQLEVEFSLPIALASDDKLGVYSDGIWLEPIPYDAVLAPPTPSSPPPSGVDVPVEKL